MNLIRYRTTGELRADAVRWDDLWLRSEVTAPSLRAAAIADWVDRFAAGEPLAAVAVEQQGRLLAALPLVARRRSPLVRVGCLPVDDWHSAADILLDPQVDAAAVCRRLVPALTTGEWSLFWFQTVPYATPRWIVLCEAMRAAGMSVSIHEQYQVPVVQLADSWQAYEASVPGKHRRSRRRYRKLMEQDGEVELEVVHSPQGEQLDRLLQTGFEIETRSWKGDGGTALLHTPGMFEFYRRQAQQLAEWGQLALVFLKFNGRPIAFSYAWQSKGTHFCVKLAYDEAFRQYGPGQQMNLRLLEALHDDPGCRTLDFWGRLMPWNESWATSSYPLGRLVAAPPRAVARGLFRGYEILLPKMRRLRAAWRR